MLLFQFQTQKCHQLQGGLRSLTHIYARAPALVIHMCIFIFFLEQPLGLTIKCISLYPSASSFSLCTINGKSLPELPEVERN